MYIENREREKEREEGGEKERERKGKRERIVRYCINKLNLLRKRGTRRGGKRTNEYNVMDCAG